MTRAKRDSRTVVFEGSVTQDATLGEDVVCSPATGALTLWKPSGGRYLLPLATSFVGPSEVAALRPMEPLLSAPVVSDVKLGGAARAACAAAEVGNGAALRVGLVNETEETQGLTEMCASMGIEQISLGLMSMPVGIVISQGPKRLVVREHTQRCLNRLPEEQLRRLQSVLATADAVAVVCSNDSFAARTAFAPLNGARRYLQPATPPYRKRTQALVHSATDIVLNFQKLLALAASAGMTAPGLWEAAPQAPAWGAAMLRQLRQKGLAGALSAVVTLGQRGALAADWRQDRIHWLAFQPLGKRALVVTPIGTGHRFFGAMIVFNEIWADRGFLKDPVVASVSRAMRFVAGCLGIPEDSYDLEITLL